MTNVLVDEIERLRVNNAVRKVRISELELQIERLRAALERFVRALDRGHAPALEDYDAARMALRHPDSA